MKPISKNIFLIVPEFSFFMSHRFELIKGLLNDGISIDIITHYNNFDKLPNIPGLNFIFLDSHRQSFNIINLLKLSPMLRRLIITKNPDFIYAISHRSILLSTLASLFLRKRLIFENDVFYKKQFEYQFE